MAFKSYFEARVLGGLLELEEYLKTTEKYLLDVSTGREAWLGEQAEALPPEERNEFYERNIDFHRTYAEIFPRILRNSFLVSVHSLLEHKMDFVCKRIKEERQIPINLSDLRGDALDQFKLYSKLAGLDLQYDAQTWQEINNYYLIRNCIVHNNGSLNGFRDENRLRAYVNQKSIVSHNEITLTEQFCKEVIRSIWIFLNEVLEAYELYSKKLKQVP